MSFTITDDRTNLPHHVVRMTGELDIATAPKLRAHLVSLFEDGTATITVDLDQLKFIDSSGLGVLVTAFKRAHERDGEISLICSDDRILKVLSITGLDSIFPLYGSLDSLLAG